MNCHTCEADISHKRKGARYCSKRCKDQAHYWKHCEAIREAKAEQARVRYKRLKDEDPNYVKSLYAKKRDRLKAERDEVRDAVFAHFGDCAQCGSSDDLTLDHINNDGRAHRELLKDKGVHGTQTGHFFYEYLVNNGYDTDGYEVQVLCWPCHRAKSVADKRSA